MQFSRTSLGVYFAVAFEFVLEHFALTACICFIQLERGPLLSCFNSIFGCCVLTKDSFAPFCMLFDYVNCEFNGDGNLKSACNKHMHVY